MFLLKVIFTVQLFFFPVTIVCLEVRLWVYEKELRFKQKLCEKSSIELKWISWHQKSMAVTGKIGVLHKFLKFSQ